MAITASGYYGLMLDKIMGDEQLPDTPKRKHIVVVLGEAIINTSDQLIREARAKNVQTNYPS